MRLTKRFCQHSELENFRYAEASYNLGRLYSARGESDMAVREWRRALSIDPATPGGCSGTLARREASLSEPGSQQ